MTEERFIIENLFRIDNKEREDVPFILNETQRRLDDNFTGRDIIVKERDATSVQVIEIPSPASGKIVYDGDVIVAIKQAPDQV